MITDLGHPAFAAHDVARTLEFYALLGVGEAFRLHHDDGSLALVYLRVSGDRFVEVFPGGPRADSDRTQSFMQLSEETRRSGGRPAPPQGTVRKPHRRGSGGRTAVVGRCGVCISTVGT